MRVMNFDQKAVKYIQNCESQKMKENTLKT